MMEVECVLVKLVKGLVGIKFNRICGIVRLVIVDVWFLSVVICVVLCVFLIKFLVVRLNV